MIEVCSAVMRISCPPPFLFPVCGSFYVVDYCYRTGSLPLRERKGMVSALIACCKSYNKRNKVYQLMFILIKWIIFLKKKKKKQASISCLGGTLFKAVYLKTKLWCFYLPLFFFYWEYLLANRTFVSSDPFWSCHPFLSWSLLCDIFITTNY